MKWLNAIAALLSALLLSGCFTSQQPRFPLAGAAAPFGEGGRYAVYQHEEGDRYKREEVFAAKRQPDGAYEFVDEKGEPLTVSFHALGDNLFVGQAKEKDKSDYSYVVFRITQTETILFTPQCNDQDKAALKSLGVEVSDQFECVIDKVADPAGLFRRVDLGKPVSKLVRE